MVKNSFIHVGCSDHNPMQSIRDKKPCFIVKISFINYVKLFCHVRVGTIQLSIVKCYSYNLPGGNLSLKFTLVYCNRGC